MRNFWAIACLLFLSFSLCSRQLSIHKGLFKKAIKEKLHLEPQWGKFLHYKESLFSTKSRADDNRFFLSKNGDKDRRAELEATITAFLQSPEEDQNKHAICLFPARFQWLDAKLQLSTVVPKVKCDRFERYKERLQAQGLSLVFVAADADEPASMFGHTFIRIHQNSELDHPEDQTLSFVALVDTNNPFTYIVKGVGGGFHGRIDFMRFAKRRDSYNVLENRNMWQLRLNFTQEEISRFIAHLWELDNTFFYYHFFDENCAYLNFFLLEVARPSWNVADSYFYTVIPADTIRDMLRNKRVINQAKYYPANLNDYLETYNQLSSSEKDAMDILLKSQGKVISQDERVRPDAVVSTAGYFTLLSIDRDSGKLPEEKKLIYDNLLDLQKQMGLSQVSFARPDYTNPAIGHGTAMGFLGFGSGSRGNFYSLAFRPAFHDIIDSPPGYMLFSEVESFSGELRYYQDSEIIQLQEFNLINVISIKPIQAGRYTGSWFLRGGARSLLLEFPEENRVLAGNLQGGYGVSFLVPFMGNMAIYLLPGLLFEGAQPFEHSVRFSITGTGGLIFNPTDAIALHANIEYQPFFVPGQTKELLITTGGINLSFTDHFALEFHYKEYILNQQREFNGIAKFYW